MGPADLRTWASSSLLRRCPETSFRPGASGTRPEHLLAYSVLGVLFLIPTAEARPALVTPRTGALAVVLATLYGAFDEIHQAFTPGRSPDIHDLFADFLGAAAGVIVVLLLRFVVTRLTYGGRPDVRLAAV